MTEFTQVDIRKINRIGWRFWQSIHIIHLTTKTGQTVTVYSPTKKAALSMAKTVENNFRKPRGRQLQAVYYDEYEGL